MSEKFIFKINKTNKNVIVTTICKHLWIDFENMKWRRNHYHYWKYRQFVVFRPSYCGRCTDYGQKDEVGWTYSKILRKRYSSVQKTALQINLKTVHHFESWMTKVAVVASR